MEIYNDKIPKGFEWVEKVSAEYIKTPDYSPETSNEQWDYNRLRNQPTPFSLPSQTSNAWKVLTTDWTNVSWQYTKHKAGVISSFVADVNNETTTITGVWFTPRFLKFTAYNDGDPTYSWGSYDGTNQIAIRLSPSIPTYNSYSGECIDWGTKGSVTVDSVNSDWFVLKFAVSATSTYQHILWEAYG